MKCHSYFNIIIIYILSWIFKKKNTKYFCYCKSDFITLCNLKFRYSEKATKFDKISHYYIWHYLVTSKKLGDFSKNFCLLRKSELYFAKKFSPHCAKALCCCSIAFKLSVALVWFALCAWATRQQATPSN